jgi:hypothetical protein
MAAFQPYLQSEKQKSRVSGQEFPGETVRCHYATVSSIVAKVRGEVFAHFRSVAVKRHIHCLVFQVEVFMNNSP